MINSIRTVRRAKGLTLEEVAQRCDPAFVAARHAAMRMGGLDRFGVRRAHQRDLVTVQ